MTDVTQQYSPTTGALLEAVPNTPVEDMPKIFAKARAAQTLWAGKTFKQRAAHMKKIKTFLARECDRGAEIISQNNGKARQDALASEILPGVMACDWYASNAGKVLADESLPCGNVLFTNKKNRLRYSPVGVVGIISPWNYPFAIPFGEVIMGLMAGNAIILKVAPETTLVGNFLDECMRAGDLPDGLFTHCVVDGPDFSKALFECGVDKLFFTGSLAVGKILMASAAPTLTPLSLELGGKDPMIVCADASLERAVNCATWGAFTNAGQTCAGIERVYVHESIYDKFVEAVVAKTKTLRHGPDVSFNVDIGAITAERQLKHIRKQIEAAVEAGAVIAAQSCPTGNVSGGNFFPATVLTNVNHTMSIMKDETFGPVLPIMKFRSVEEAISLANDSTMALTSSVFCNNSSEANRIASRLQSGVVSINDHLMTHGISETPWGGWKDTGIGRTHGPLGLKEMSNVQCINEERMPSCCVGHRNMFWYPFDKASYDGLKHAVNFLEPEGCCCGCCDYLSSGMKLAKFAVGKMFTKWKVDDKKKEKMIRASGAHKHDPMS